MDTSTVVPTVPLSRISFAKLLAKDKGETERLFQACKNLGFFSLDLRSHPEGTQLLGVSDRLLALGEPLFDLPPKELLQYRMSGKSMYGYKAQGAAIVDKNGTKDRCEFFTISSDELHGIAPASAVPSTIEGNWSLFQSFTTMAHNTVITILNSLDAPLGLPAGTLSQRHRITEPSGGSARILKYPPQPLDDQRISHAPHTDFGSVTLLFSQVGGLQVRPPGMTSAWGYVVSEPGHAVVNLGDGMVKFTNGLLRSAYHRVISPPGAQAALTRYSLVYFARAEDEVLLKRLESKVIPELCADETEDVVSTKEWILRRIQAMKQASRNKAEWDGIKGTEDLPRQKL